MASASGIRAGRAYVELGLSNSGFVKGLKESIAHIKTMGQEISHFGEKVGEVGHKLVALGGVVTAPLLAAAHHFAAAGEDLHNMSKRTGISTQALQELGFAAEISGASLGDVEQSVKRMQRTILEALIDPAGAAANALGDLKLSAQDLQTIAPGDQLEVVLQRLGELPTAAARAGTAIKVFGRGGTVLLPMLENLAKTREEAQRLGLVMSKEDVEAAVALHRSWEVLLATVKSLWNAIGSALAPTLSASAKRITEIVASARVWIQHNQGLVVSIFKLATAVTAVGLALTILGPLIGAVGTAFTILGTVGGAAITFLVSPLGLITAALAGLGIVIARSTGVAGDAIDWLKGRFGALKVFAIDVFKGIKDAMSANDLALAAEIAWLGIKIVWSEGLAVLMGLWRTFKTFLLTEWAILTTAIEVAVQEMLNAVEERWVFATNAWKELFTRVANVFVNVWTIATDEVAKMIVKIMGAFDKGIDVQATVQEIDRVSRAGFAKQQAGAEKEQVARDKDLTDTKARGAAKVEAILTEGTKEVGTRTTADTQAAKEDQDRIKALKEQLALKIAQAATEKQIAENEIAVDRAAPPTLPNFTPPEEVKKTVTSVLGTFNPAVLSRIGVGPSSSEERQTKAAEKTAKNTDEIRRKLLEAKNLVFAED